MKAAILISWLMVLGLVTGAAAGLAEGEEAMIPAGDRFVEFDLEAHDGSTVSSEDLQGRTFLLFFYPKADTPG